MYVCTHTFWVYSYVNQIFSVCMYAYAYALCMSVHVHVCKENISMYLYAHICNFWCTRTQINFQSTCVRVHVRKENFQCIRICVRKENVLCMRTRRVCVGCMCMHTQTKYCLHTHSWFTLTFSYSITFRFAFFAFTFSLHKYTVYYTHIFLNIHQLCQSDLKFSQNFTKNNFVEKSIFHYIFFSERDERK